MFQKILKTGHSMCVTIPAKFAKTLGLKPGQLVQTKVDLANGTITNQFSGSNQLQLLSQK